MNTPKTDDAIELLVIDNSLNSAEAKVSTLRNASLAIHPVFASTREEIEEALINTPQDMILLSANSSNDEFQEKARLCIETSPEIPLIVIGHDQEPELLLGVMQEGARDLVSEEDDEHLQLVVKREWRDLLIHKQLKQTEAKLKEAEIRCTALIASSRDAIAYIHEGMHMHANQAYLDMFGYMDMEELEGLTILDEISSKEQKRFKSFLRTHNNENAELMIECRRTDDSTFEAKLEFTGAALDGEPCTQIVIRNFSQNKELEEKIELLSNIDVQTGLVNRQYFMEHLDQQVVELHESKESCSLFYLSIDNAQKIRSTIGIQATDNLLKGLAKLIQEIVGEDELVGRFGDHTFTILSSKSSNLDVEPMAEQLRDAIEGYSFKEFSDSGMPTTGSIGITILDHYINSGQEHINRAYQACETARNEGGNGFSLYDSNQPHEEYSGGDGDESKIEDLITYALDNDRFRIVYQPIVSLQGDSRENYAVLSRLLGRNDEEILPNFFMKQAGDNEQMAQIDRWVIKRAITELSTYRQQGRKINFFINLSAAALNDEGLLLWVCDCLRDNKAKGAWLTFQIRDQDIRAHLQAAKKLVAGLKKIKCQMAISNFGCNPKVEPLLKHLPVDFVKFDSEIMDEVATKQAKQEQLNQLNATALEHNIKTIAMGIEDANSLAILWTVGVNYIQGYFLQEPAENLSYEFGSS
ncbi:MAG: EAL domain-containing protein [Sedimenticola sp.]